MRVDAVVGEIYKLDPRFYAGDDRGVKRRFRGKLDSHEAKGYQVGPILLPSHPLLEKLADRLPKLVGQVKAWSLVEDTAYINFDIKTGIRRNTSVGYSADYHYRGHDESPMAHARRSEVYHDPRGGTCAYRDAVADGLIPNRSEPKIRAAMGPEINTTYPINQYFKFVPKQQAA